jgi:hypothetical protein
LLKRNSSFLGDVWEVIGQLKEELSQEKRAREKLEEDMAAMQASIARLLTSHPAARLLSPVEAPAAAENAVSASSTEATLTIPAPGNLLPSPS